MRLATFIELHIEPILAEWEVFARSISAGANMTSLALRNNAGDILRATARDMNSVQSLDEQARKSRGRDADSDVVLDGVSEEHAAGRLGAGFNLLDVVSEYRALRASVLHLWRESKPEHDDFDVDDITRFNESIDQSLSKAVASYTKRVDQSRDMYLAILGHDLRNPLNSIAMSAELLPHLSHLGAESIGCTTQITSSAGVMGRMISDLLDYTRTRLGAGMPVVPAPMDLAVVGQEIYQEYKASYPKRAVRFACDGELKGSWDVDRLRQAISNLMGNAIQHGIPDAPILLGMLGTDDEVTVSVHNGGPPISAGELPRIFDPLVRGSSTGGVKKNRAGSIGMGLYIAREIAQAHDGTIAVVSTMETGTTFTIHLPRQGGTYVGPTVVQNDRKAMN